MARRWTRIEDSLQLELANLNASRALGAIIADAAPPGLLLTLRGELGAGKTTLARAIAAGLDVDRPVTSPKFVLVREYALSVGPDRPTTLVHADLYRLRDPVEVEGLALDEWLQDGALVLVEWPEIGDDVLPDDRLCVTLEPVDPDVVAAIGTSRTTSDAHRGDAPMDELRRATLVATGEGARKALSEIADRWPPTDRPSPDSCNRELGS